MKLTITLTFLMGFSLFSHATTSVFRKSNLKVLESQGHFKTLLVALKAAELEDDINQIKRATLFAPTDEAFAKIPSETLQEILANKKLLTKILLYHVSPTKLTAKKVGKRKEIKTLAGKTILTNISDKGVFLNNTQVIEVNQKTKNGIIHTINSVLVPNEDLPNNEIVTEQNIDLSRYLGTWYEIARYENSFQKKCFGTKAIYAKKGKFIKVTNICQKENGDLKKGHALATVKNKETNASLNVSFVPFFKLFGWFGGDYNILKVGENYEYALVGDTKRSTFWILTRDPVISEDLYQSLLNVAEEKGYRRELIKKSPAWKF